MQDRTLGRFAIFPAFLGRILCSLASQGRADALYAVQDSKSRSSFLSPGSGLPHSLSGRAGWSPDEGSSSAP